MAKVKPQKVSGSSQQTLGQEQLQHELPTSGKDCVQQANCVLNKVYQGPWQENQESQPAENMGFARLQSRSFLGQEHDIRRRVHLGFLVNFLIDCGLAPGPRPDPNDSALWWTPSTDAVWAPKNRITVENQRNQEVNPYYFIDRLVKMVTLKNRNSHSFLYAGNGDRKKHQSSKHL